MYDGNMGRTAKDFDETQLRDVAGMTELMRVHEREIRKIAEKRTIAARRHQERGVTYDQLANAMGLSGVAVYKLLRGREGSIRARRAKEEQEK